ncbi:MAG: ABC transporter ATP-binding protein [Candidatus Parvarchaeota archaeon]|nr:ABC transporter ATP-binding protein [Candidatus Jingweiarchaeum tengchongense]MCW1305943.1 ABC transporter ATP-binding protein [Candidatus Jingweiarchaeum tengchongense]
MAWIELENITKNFGKVSVIKNLSLQIEKGEFVSILGPSGCGKTTLLRLIAGLEVADKGKINIAGTDVTFSPPNVRKIAMVFQNYALYPHMTVFKNISYPLFIKKIPADEIKQRVNTIADNLKISPLLDRYPQQISGGQQQRVAVARAMIQTPNVFLLDEPLSNLDAMMRIEARGFLKYLLDKIGTTTIYVTHDQSEAMALANRIVVMQNGIIQQVGSPKDIYDKPSNIFVASFVGNPPMNLLQATINSTQVKIGDQYLDIKESITNLRKPLQNGKVYLGIRPEHISIYHEDSKNDGPIVEGEIFVSEPLGFETIITVIVSDQQIKVIKFGGSKNLKPGEKIKLQFKKNKIYIFEFETGYRINEIQGDDYDDH